MTVRASWCQNHWHNKIPNDCSTCLTLQVWRSQALTATDVQTAVDSEVPEPQPQPQDQTRTAAEPTSQVQNGDAAEPDRAQSDARKAKIAVNAHPAGSQMPSASPVTEQHDNFRALQVMLLCPMELAFQGHCLSSFVGRQSIDPLLADASQSRTSRQAKLVHLALS